jgi:hypothetical protein
LWAENGKNRVRTDAHGKEGVGEGLKGEKSSYFFTDFYQFYIPEICVSISTVFDQFISFRL